MRIHPTDPRLYLVELPDFRETPQPPQVQENLEPLTTIVNWATDYLCRPHPELGRTGAVCPFTQPSLRRNLFFLTVIRGAELRLDDVEEVVRAYRDWFMEMPPTEPKQAQYKTVNIIFPDLPEEAWKTLIEATQDRLKAEYVPHGIMIGEFHPGPPDKAALWNANFRPLHCPLPMLVIRHMVPTDFVFLRDREDFMSAYLRLQGDRIPPVIIKDVRLAAAAFGLPMPGEAVVREAVQAAGDAVPGAVPAECPAHAHAAADAADRAAPPASRCPEDAVPEPALTSTRA
ncbi:MAG TPA: hypothetical protein VGC13_07560 [Longimicrobium sp.]|jgi:hypothetical protein|uniref:DUF6875 domain-containing protein n=1 Tax=Longimicrobium sp. TaxID=2029185 RepID=UPI002ED877B4